MNLAPSSPSSPGRCPSAPVPFLFACKLLLTLQNSAHMRPPLQNLPSPPPLTREATCSFLCDPVALHTHLYYITLGSTRLQAIHFWIFCSRCLISIWCMGGTVKSGWLHEWQTKYKTFTIPQNWGNTTHDLSKIHPVCSTNKHFSFSSSRIL